MTAVDYATQYPSLANRPFPATVPSKTTTIPAGRKIGYEEYVDASYPAESLKTVVLIPGTPGCRMFTHPSVRTLGHIQGCRLIVMERPGFGLSDPPRTKASDGVEQSYTIFALQDFQPFCESLNLRKIHLIGYSAGTPFALAAASLCPGLVACLALVSTIGPPETPQSTKHMALLFRVGYFACRNLPWLVRMIVNSEAQAARKHPLKALRDAFKPYTCKQDIKTSQSPAVEELFLESALEIYSRKQEGTILHENLLFTRPWGFSPSDIKVPVAFWQGVEDTGCTPEMACFLAGQIEGSKLTLVPGAGHMVYFDVWDEMVDWLLHSLPAEAEAVAAS